MKENPEQYDPTGIDKIVARRKKALKYVAAGTVFVIGAWVSAGYRLFPPEITTESRSYEKVTNPSDGNAYIETDDYLRAYETFEWSHRAGNSIKEINKAVKKDANYLEVDINIVNGEPEAEHGWVFRKEILGKEINLVFDPYEGELNTNPRPKFEEIVQHVDSLSTPEKPLGLYLDFKHGPDPFTDQALEKMIDILIKYKMPAIIQPEEKDLLYKIEQIYDRKKALLATAEQS